jgi:hypothetical protein
MRTIIRLKKIPSSQNSRSMFGKEPIDRDTGLTLSLEAFNDVPSHWAPIGNSVYSWKPLGPRADDLQISLPTEGLAGGVIARHVPAETRFISVLDSKLQTLYRIEAPKPILSAFFSTFLHLIAFTF